MNTSRENLLRWLRRSFVIGWLLITVIGAMNHTIMRGLLKWDGPMVQIFPHLRWGFVMFNITPRRTPVPMVRFADSTKFVPLSALSKTPAIGYADARSVINFLLAPEYISYLCATNPKAENAEFRVQMYGIGEKATLLGTQLALCQDGQLHETPG